MFQVTHQTSVIAYHQANSSPPPPFTGCFGRQRERERERERERKERERERNVPNVFKDSR